MLYVKTYGNHMYQKNGKKYGNHMYQKDSK